jgi:hypothetical protein
MAVCASALAAEPSFSGQLTRRDHAFAAFVRANMGRTVQLALSFEEVPYDYRGTPGMALWYPSRAGNPSANHPDYPGFIFEGEGSWDQRTGYARQGRLLGRWKITGQQKLGGQVHYRLIQQR